MAQATIHFILLILMIYQNKSEDLTITRAERDIFTNVARCSVVNAQCYDKNCISCRCSKGHETFVHKRGRHGECVSNENLVYVISSEQSFQIKSSFFSRCLTYEMSGRTPFVVAKRRCWTSLWRYRWLWTKHGHIVNMNTLECITDDYLYGSINYLTMKKCDKTNAKQRWQCLENHKYRLLQLETLRYMNYGEDYVYVSSSQYRRNKTDKWKRSGTNADVCSQGVQECETFISGVSLVTLNRTECEEKNECRGHKEIITRTTHTKCSILANKTQYFLNETWNKLLLPDASFEITLLRRKLILKWDLKKAPQSWKGIIVKVQFECQAEVKQCLLIKFAGVFDGFYKESGKNKETEKNNKDRKNNETKIDKKGSKNNETDANKKKSESGNWRRAITTSVSVLVALLVLGVLAFIVYRQKERLFSKRKSNNESQENVIEMRTCEKTSSSEEIPCSYYASLNQNRELPQLYQSLTKHTDYLIPNTRTTQLTDLKETDEDMSGYENIKEPPSLYASLTEDRESPSLYQALKKDRA